MIEDIELDELDEQELERRIEAEAGPCITRPMTPEERAKYPPLHPTRAEIIAGARAGKTLAEVVRETNGTMRQAYYMALRARVLDVYTANLRRRKSNGSA